MSDGREVWITGVGLITCLGEGLEAAWDHLERGDAVDHLEIFEAHAVASFRA